MSSSIIARYVTPWKYRRELEQQRLQALKGRDGENCARCRRPLRFDLPEGHDMAPKVEPVLPVAKGEEPPLDNLVLTHRRCNGEGADYTHEVTERIRRRNEAELFANARRRKRA
jgi:5-methylcytosine-specific restriction endonuclease McrA